MRADRLVATLLLLQARGRVTAAEVAAELEVSLKTARRDLEALSLAGLPVYSQPGRGGGWQLLGGARTDLSGLTAVEARTLFLVAGPAAAVTPAAKAALRKLMRALPETFRADAEAAAEAVILDPTGWGKTPTPSTPHMEELQRAVIEKVQVRLTYADHRGAQSVRLVHPLGLAAKGGNWYLIADSDKGRRTFRVSRIRSAALTDLPAVRPDGFDLTEAWQSIAASVEERRTRVRATITVDADILTGLRAQLGSDVTVSRRTPEGRFEAQIAGSSPQSIALQVAGWGKGIEVIDPEEVRRELARIGRELADVYGKG
jgi:predicted DNA-binding transcriptional regulator YafY